MSRLKRNSLVLTNIKATYNTDSYIDMEQQAAHSRQTNQTADDSATTRKATDIAVLEELVVPFIGDPQWEVIAYIGPDRPDTDITVNFERSRIRYLKMA